MSSVGDDRIDLRALISMFRRRVGLFLAVLLSVLILGMVITALQTPTFIATSRVSLNAKVEPITPAGSTDRSPMPNVPSESYVDTQASVITSEEAAGRVVDALGLARNPRIIASGHGSGLKAWLSNIFSAKPNDEKLTAADARAAAIAYVQSGASATRVGTTYAIDIAFEGVDSDEASRISNALAEQYTSGRLNAQKSADRQSSALILDRANAAQTQYLNDVAAVQRYRLANNIPSTTGSSLTEQEVSTYNQQVATARAQAAEDAARLETAKSQLKSGSRGDDVGEALGSPVVSDLRTRQAQASSDLAQLTARYGNDYPNVIKARGALAAIDNQIAAEIQRVISNLDAKARVSNGRLASLQGTLSSARGTLYRNGAASIELAALEQKADSSKSQYESYLNRYRELAAREGTEQADASLLTAATPPIFPTTPNKLLNMILALALGIGLGFAAALLAEMTFAGITTGDEIEERLQARYLGTIPLLSSVGPRKGSPAVAVATDPRSAFAEALRSLRASIAFNSPIEAKVLAITSALPQEGKTTTSICLARSMAMAGDRVVLVDCDLRRHGVSSFLQRERSRPGLVEVLRGTAPLADALANDDATGLKILPIAESSEGDAELLTGEAMDRLLEKLRSQFDAVIIDTAPVLPIADARLILGKADLALFVVRWRKTPDHAVRSALRLLPADRVHLAGVVLSRVNMRRQAKFGYGDDSFYYRSYKSYYA
jgi:capsular exopolysaccharide synthesis family protein